MPNWPSELPQRFVRGDFKRKPIANATAIDTESGEPMTRLRFTGDQSTVGGSIVMSGDNLAIFRDFWKNDLKRGTLRFTWDDALTGEAVEMLFADTPEEAHIDGDNWRVTLSLTMFA